ncbi:MAG: M48 family metalloprotease [Proteobacteria bacterium]|nr:M48 family metalloprotease [Pseudomonadota bacterium]
MKMRIFIPIYLICFLYISGCAVNPVTGQQDLVLLSESDEISLGRKTHQEVLKQYAVYEDPALQKYVQDIGTKLAAKSHRNNLVYRFTVLDSKEVNAFALPGGYIYITRGLMAYLKSEAELAAVLGHEIGHVTARHSVRQYSANQLTNIGLVLGSIFVPGMNQASNQLAQLFGAALLRGYGREHELEADRLGAEYLARTNYNPQAMLDVISVLKDQEIFETELARAEGRQPRIYHGVFSTHPDNDKRLQEVVGTAKQLSDTSKAQYVGHEEYLSFIDNMVYGDSPREGILRGGRFFHSDLNFAMSFPRKWTVTNRPDVIILTAPEGSALIQISVEDINKKISPRDFMFQRLGLSNLDSESSLSINGLPAHTGISVVRTTEGSRPTRFVVIYYEQRAYIIAGTSKEPGQIAKFDQLILNTAKSFHQLTENERVLAKPLRLSVVQAGESTRFIDLARQSPLENHAESKLRLLNAKYPHGEARKGELLKIVK